MNSQDQEVLLKNLKALAKENNLDISAEIAKIEQKMETSARAVDKVWEKVSIARNPDRPRTLDYIEMIFDDRKVIYDISLLDDIEHAYAITVHKSQGSEYPIVVIPAYQAPPMLLTRNLLYTGVTRAQRMVVLVGREDIISKMLENDRAVEVFSMRDGGVET